MLKNIDEYDDVNLINTTVESTLMHEGVHHGRHIKGLSRRIANKEAGKVFEKRAYGKDVGRNGNLIHRLNIFQKINK